MINQVMSWNDCGARCLANSNCQFWTWHHGNAGIWANDCVLMSGYGYSRNNDSNTISGARGCNGKYENDECFHQKLGTLIDLSAQCLMVTVVLSTVTVHITRK